MWNEKSVVIFIEIWKKDGFQSNVNGIIRKVFNSLFFFFFYEKILHAPKAPKAQKAQKAQKTLKTLKAQKRNQAKAQKAQKRK